MFFHYSVDIESTDSLCLILKTFDHADADNRAPNGWQDWLRPDSQKAFVVITDDSAHCTYEQGESRVEFGEIGADPFDDALRFHEALLAEIAAAVRRAAQHQVSVLQHRRPRAQRSADHAAVPVRRPARA